MNAYKARSDKYATINDEPTMTEQSEAADTDINLIVKRYGVYGTAPGALNPPQYGDYADLPTTLAEAFELMRSVPTLKSRLPEELAALTIEDIVNLTPDALNDILKPAPTPTPTPTPAGA